MVEPYGPLSAGLNLAASNAYNKLCGFVDIGDSMKRLKKTLGRWSRHPAFVAMLESHDTPRFTSRASVSGEEALSILFDADPRIVCLYQGQELGLLNPELSNDIGDYQDIQTIMRYEKAVQSGVDPTRAFADLKPESRDNARVAIDIAEYEAQMANPNSCWATTQRYVQEWKVRD